MSDTHKHTQLGRFMLRYRGVIQAATLGIALSVVTSMQESIEQQAHFLQRSLASSSAASQASVAASSTQRITTRSSAAIQRRMAVEGQKTERINSSSRAPALRAAAPSSRSRGVPTGGTTVRASSAASISALPSSSSSASSLSAGFPAFGNAVHPVSRVPNWGNMRTPAEWNRTYSEMHDDDFVEIPAYNMSTLTVPMDELLTRRDDADTIRILTAKLYYSTRHFSAYDIDSGEFSADHPGVDLKLPEGTPVGAVAGGRVHDIRTDADGLGLHIILEHRAPDGQTYYSVYGHLAAARVSVRDSVASGEMIGTVGMSGFTTGPHIHLQIDLGVPDEAFHTVYWPAHTPSRPEAAMHTINPIEFIRRY